LEFVIEPVVTAKGVANHVKVNQLDAGQGPKVPVVSGFPDVFPEELPGMPPNCDIEFVIELLPGTAPIYKSPYRMATTELAKLKEHIKELLIHIKEHIKELAYKVKDSSALAHPHREPL
jgi:hypothetical protein